MNITINDKQKELNEAVNLEQLITDVLKQDDGLIIRYNDKLINRNHWKDHTLKDGDEIQLIQFVGGG